ncbi:hypothetical protein BHE74_00047736 [Ensete ventricosum]|nr:hypothetical protein BHE74_00047736 [Ensete ventricosum]
MYHPQAIQHKVVKRARHIVASDMSYKTTCALNAATCSIGSELLSYGSSIGSRKCLMVTVRRLMMQCVGFLPLLQRVTSTLWVGPSRTRATILALSQLCPDHVGRIRGDPLFPLLNVLPPPPLSPPRVTPLPHVSTPPFLYNHSTACPSRLPINIIINCLSDVYTYNCDMGDRERHPMETTKGLIPEKGPTATQALTVATMFPFGGLLLTLAVLTLTGSVIGLVVLAPVFLLFSPVLVPAALLMALAVAGFLASGAFGLTGLSSLGYTLKQARGVVQRAPEQIDYGKRRMAEAARQMGQKTKDVGQAVQSRAEEAKRT